MCAMHTDKTAQDGLAGGGPALFRLVRYWSRRWAADAARAGADDPHVGHVLILEAIDAAQAAGSGAIGEVARQLGLDRSNASRMLAEAVAAGLVTILLARMHVDFNVGCTALMLLGTQWYILFNVIAGASSIPADLREVASIYRWTGFQRWTRLYIPCVFPYLVTGLITAAGGAWNATIVAEYVVMKRQTYTAFGLGSIINHASADGNFPLLAASVVTMAVAVVLLNRSVWRQLYRVAERRFSLTT